MLVSRMYAVPDIGGPDWGAIALYTGVGVALGVAGIVLWRHETGRGPTFGRGPGLVRRKRLFGRSR